MSGLFKRERQHLRKGTQRTRSLGGGWGERGGAAAVQLRRVGTGREFAVLGVRAKGKLI